MMLGNESMTNSYRDFIYGNQIPAIISVYTQYLGNWFYVAVMMIPYAAMTLNQRTINLATIWLTCCFLAYGSLVDGWAFTTWVPYLLLLVWVFDIIRRFGIPIFTN
jgi:hypothetical protein